MISDEPATHDAFERKHFAMRIARMIGNYKSPDNVSIGVYGEWGDGKTTILQMVDRELADNFAEKTMRIWFNPWRFASEDALLAGLYQLIRDALSSRFEISKQKAGALIKNAARFIPKLAVGPATLDAGSTIAAISDALSGPTTPVAQYDELTKLLAKHEIRMVIFVDDVDRLFANDLVLLFKTIKLALGFKFVTFVLAMDDKRVAQAISGFFSKDEEAGSLFLEKIIQLPLHLPKPTSIQLEDFTMSLILASLESSGSQWTTQQQLRFLGCFKNGFAYKVTTPRIAKRFANAIAFAVPALKDEVDLCDLAVIEGIRLFQPQLYEAIRVSNLFAEEFQYEFLPTEKKKVDEAIEKSLGSRASKTEISSAIYLVRALRQRTSSDSELGVSKRIYQSEYFDRYFLYGIAQSDISDNVMDEIVSRHNRASDPLALVLSKPNL